MSGRFRIACIKKPHRESPLEHITEVGGPGGGGWKLTVDQCIYHVEALREQFYVVAAGYEADVVVVDPPGRRKYIKTTPDATKKDNLLSLPGCS
jgi:hypothetical protein